MESTIPGNRLTMMLIIAGYAHVDAKRRDEYVASFRDMVERSRSAPGCLDLFVSTDLLEPTRVNIFERWASREDLAAWRKQADPPDTDIEMTSNQVTMFT